jgi:hypothetical protein
VISEWSREEARVRTQQHTIHISPFTSRPTAAVFQPKGRREKEVEHSSMARFQDSAKNVIFNPLKFRQKKGVLGISLLSH